MLHAIFCTKPKTSEDETDLEEIYNEVHVDVKKNIEDIVAAAKEPKKLKELKALENGGPDEECISEGFKSGSTVINSSEQSFKVTQLTQIHPERVDAAT